MVSDNAFGEQKVLVMLVNFEDNQKQLFSSGYAQDMVFTQTNNFRK